MSRTALLALLVSLAVGAPSVGAGPFTYQGHLEFNGVPVHGSADLVFRLFDSETGGTPIDSPMQATDWPVAQGIFTIDLDFAGVVFDGSPRWLEVEANGQVLAGRIPVMGAPFAHSANALRGRGVAATAPGTGQVLAWSGSAWAPADAAAGSSYEAGTGLDLVGETFSILPDYRLPQGCAGDQVPKWSGVAWACANDTDTTYSAEGGLILAGTAFSLAPTYRLPQACSNGQVAKWDGSGWICAADADTSYAAGEGLELDSGSFRIGSAYRLPQGCPLDSVPARDAMGWYCRSLDHEHFGASWSGAIDGFGLSVSQSTSDSGWSAISGTHFGATATGIGVQGRAMGPAAGIGVQGEGTRFGIEGVVVSTSAEAAVHGWAAAGASAAHGIKGQAEASTSRAVIGLHEHSEGIALEGRAHSTDPGSATGVLGASSAIGGFGVRGEGSTGVRGTGGTGVSAEGAQFGVSGLATETTGVGVEGVASSPTGNTTGVLARALSPAGVALKAENFADDAVTAHFQAWGGGATVALRSESRGDVPGALALHATLDNGSGDGTALFAEHRGGGVAVKLDGVLRMTPRASAPANCELGDLYVHDSGALCFCNGALAWERINTAGLCP